MVECAADPPSFESGIDDMVSDPPAQRTLAAPSVIVASESSNNQSANKTNGKLIELVFMRWSSRQCSHVACTRNYCSETCYNRPRGTKCGRQFVWDLFKYRLHGIYTVDSKTNGFSLGLHDKGQAMAKTITEVKKRKNRVKSVYEYANKISSQ
jgi:hypothetical protein